jgi:o-succinylbenzoate---CoA ligase
VGSEFDQTVNDPYETGGAMLLDGRVFTRSELLDYSLKQQKDPGVPTWRKEVYSFIALFLDPDGGAIIQKSSGSTGDPKSFTLSKEAMLRSAQRTLRFFDFKKGERALLSLPVQYIAGKMMVVRALSGGLDLLLTEPSSRPLKHLKGTIDFASMVPLQVEETLQQGDPLERISKLIIGGGELFPATREKLSSMMLPEVYETFGMTETYTHFAMKRINGPDPQSFFKLLDGVRIGLDPRGCLEVDVPGITSGTLVTSDLVEINQRGDGFSWLGRFDNLINTGGVKIIPELLEEQISECIGHDCLVLPEPDRKLGQRLALVVEFEGDDPPVDDWLDQLRERVSNYELPRRVVAIQSLPRNASMKPDRTSARTLLL